MWPFKKKTKLKTPKTDTEALVTGVAHAIHLRQKYKMPPKPTYSQTLNTITNG